MGASIVAYWPDITDEQLDAQPGFYNDDRAWANLMAEIEKATEVQESLKKLKADALLTFKTDPMEDDEVWFVTPQELRDAATALRDAVIAGVPDTKAVVDCYALGANKIDPVAQELVVDLNDIIEIATWAEGEGAGQITLEVNW